MYSTSSRKAGGCFVVSMLVFAILASIALSPAVYNVVTAYSLGLVLAVVLSYSVPLVFFAFLIIGWKSVPKKIRYPNPQSVFFEDSPLSSRWERLLAVWLTLVVFVFFVWLTVPNFALLANSYLTMWWSVLAAIGAVLAGGLGYLMGSALMEDRRKVSIYLGAVFSLSFGIVLVVNIWVNRESASLKFWSGLVSGLLFGFLTVWYMQKRSGPAKMMPKDQTPAERYLDHLIVNNVFVRGLVIFLTVAFFLLITSLGTGFALNFFSTWVVIILGYMSIQAFRYRPKNLQ